MKSINELHIDFNVAIADDSLLFLVCENANVVERETAKNMYIIDFYSVCKMKLNKILHELREIHKKRKR